MSSIKSNIMKPLFQDSVFGQTFGDKLNKRSKSTAVPMAACYMGVEEFCARERSVEEPLLSNNTDKNLQQQAASNKCDTSGEKRERNFAIFRLSSFCSALLGLMIAFFTVFSDVGAQAIWMYSEYRSENPKDTLKMNLIASFVWSLISTLAVVAILLSLVSTLKTGYQMASNGEKEVPEKLIFVMEGSYVAGFFFGTFIAWSLVDLFMGVTNKYHWLAGTVWAMFNALVVYKLYSGVVKELCIDGDFDINNNENDDAKDFEKDEV